MFVLGGQREGEPLQEHGSHCLGLQHGEVLANACSWANGERKQCVGVRGSFGDAILEPVGIEFIGIRPPDLLAPVDHNDRNDECSALGYADVA